MKVILRKDIAGVGVRNQVKDVSAGYAQNFLIGRGLAELATPAKIAKAEKAMQARVVDTEKKLAEIEAGIAKLKGEPLTIHATANEQDHLFEAVHTETISVHFSDVTGVGVETGSIHIKEPIKSLGEHTVQIAIGTHKVMLPLLVVNK